jgi:hypothetical protein
MVLPTNLTLLMPVLVNVRADEEMAMNSKVGVTLLLIVIVAVLCTMVGCGAPRGLAGGGGSASTNDNTTEAPGDADGPESDADAQADDPAGGSGSSEDPTSTGDADGPEDPADTDPASEADDSEGADDAAADSGEADDADGAGDTDDPAEPPASDGPEDPGGTEAPDAVEDGDTPDDSGETDTADDTDDMGPVAEKTFTIEPDDHADETELTRIDDHVTLNTTLDDNSIVSLFTVTATQDGQGLAPTGENVFGHANIPFFNNNRRLRMDFPHPARAVQVKFAGGTFHKTEVGRLQAYDGAGNLLAEHTTAELGPGESEVMTITRDVADIAWAIAYSANDDSFGRLDELTCTVLVIE